MGKYWEYYNSLSIHYAVWLRFSCQRKSLLHLLNPHDIDNINLQCYKFWCTTSASYSGGDLLWHWPCSKLEDAILALPQVAPSCPKLEDAVRHQVRRALNIPGRLKTKLSMGCLKSEITCWPAFRNMYCLAMKSPLVTFGTSSHRYNILYIYWWRLQPKITGKDIQGVPK